MTNDNTPDCGHGACGATVECMGRCKLRNESLRLPVLDPGYFDEQVRSFELPIQYAEPVSDSSMWVEYIKTAALVVGWALVLALTLYVSIK